MVAHQTVADDAHGKSARLLGKDIKVPAPVVLDEEDILAVIAALGYVMYQARNYDPCYTGHDFIFSS